MVAFDNYDEVTNVDAWLLDYAENPNLLWVTEHRHVQNIIDELIRRTEGAYQKGRDDAANDVLEEKQLPEEVFPAGSLTTRFVLDIIDKCAERAAGFGADSAEEADNV